MDVIQDKLFQKAPEEQEHLESEDDKYYHERPDLGDTLQNGYNTPNPAHDIRDAVRTQKAFDTLLH